MTTHIVLTNQSFTSVLWFTLLPGYEKFGEFRCGVTTHHEKRTPIFLSLDLTKIRFLLQVFPNASDQQTGHGIYWPRNVCVEHVPATMLGLLPSGRLFPQTVRRGARWRRRRLIIVFLCLIGPELYFLLRFVFYVPIFIDCHRVVIVRGRYYYYFYYKSFKYNFAILFSR